MPIALVAAFGFGWIAGVLRARDTAVPYTRKVFHFGIFTIAAIVHVRYGPGGVIAFGTAVVLFVLYSVARGTGNALYDALARPSDAPKERWFVVAPLVMTAIGGVSALMLFGRFATVGYLVTGWGDAVGEPVGERWGRHRYRVPSIRGVPATRSLEGSAAVFLASAIAAYTALETTGVATHAAASTALGIALVSTVVEAVSTHGVDNLTVQLVASGVAWALLRT